METLNIEIINPKAKQLILDLVALKLIKIKKKSSLSDVLTKMRAKEESVLSLEEITAEVELVRQARYAKKTKTNN